MSIKLLVLAYLSTLMYCDHESKKWTQMPGLPMLQIFAKGNSLWALSKWKQPVTWDGSRWQQYGSGADCIAANADGTGWVGFMTLANTNGAYVYYMGGSLSWTPHAPTVYLNNINGVSKDLAVGTQMPGCSQQWSNGKWTPLPGCQDRIHGQTAIGVDGDIWMIDLNGNVNRLVNGNWQRQPVDERMALATHLDVQNANRTVLTDKNQNVWLWNGSDWKQIAIWAECMQATIGAKSAYFLDTVGNVWSLDI